MRVFAGPNGSGKSAVYNLVRQQYRIGYYVNADEIEKELSEKGFLQLADLGVYLSQTAFDKYLLSSPFLNKSKESSLGINLKLKDNVLASAGTGSNSYEAAFVAELFRWEYLKNGLTFSFETVMSHPSKLEVFQKASKGGYKAYLYFVCTQDPSINETRIKNRVAKGGHPVPETKIRERYFRSLEILADAANHAYRTYLFDNSGEKSILLAELTPEKEIIIQSDAIPEWLDKYFLEKLS